MLNRSLHCLSLHSLSAVAILFVHAALLQGCILGGRNGGASALIEEPAQIAGEVSVDAYLFDVKFKQAGKRRSFRLDAYFTDSVALFTARGYLGKGVAKGIWRTDSSFFYFPTEKQYFSGPLDEMTRAGCASGGELQRLVPVLLSGRLLASIADEAITIIRQSEKEIEASVTLGGCSTPVMLLFDAQKSSDDGGALFYLKEFSYDPQDGKSKVIGKRRVLKRDKGMSTGKFKLNVPADAVSVDW